MKRKTMLIIVLIMAIGFAAISTTLYINGTSKINPNQDDFDVYYSDAYVNEIQDLSVITNDTLIEFTTTFEGLGQKYILDYEVTNGSKNYDAELVMECTGGNEYLTVTNEFDDETILEARDSRLGKLILEQTKSYVGDDIEVTIECTIDANAIERTNLNESEIQTNSPYVIEGYYVDENNNILTNKNLIIFSDIPHYVTTDNNGYMIYSGLERGNHEIYYVDDTLDNIKAMSKEDIISKSIASSNFSTSTISDIKFSNNSKLTNTLIKIYDNYCKSKVNSIYEYDYTGDVQELNIICEGNYKLEVWGAQGGTGWSENHGYNAGGKGGYASGIITLENVEKLYVYVGQKGLDPVATSYGKTTGGYNGGGGSGNRKTAERGGTGGGATDISLYKSDDNNPSSSKHLYSRLIVAGGGGGGDGHGGTIKDLIGGYGGGLTGQSGLQGGDDHYSYGGTQLSGGLGTHWSNGTQDYSGAQSGSFGIGGSIYKDQEGSGGGGGWYGGGASTYAPAGGGSGWIFNSENYNNWLNNSTEGKNKLLLTEELYLSDSVLKNGSESIPNYDGTSTMVGNTGNGYAKITYLGTN